MKVVKKDIEIAVGKRKMIHTLTSGHHVVKVYFSLKKFLYYCFKR
jgi:hypothetical protein